MAALPLRLFGVVLLLLCLGAAPAAQTSPPSKWTRVQTPHFVLMGEVGEGTLKRVAERFEQFREVFARVFPSTRQALPAPTLILVFGSERAYQPFVPVYNGKRVEVGGFFQGSPGTFFVTLSTEAGEAAYPTIFHEYTHLLVDNALANVPLWFNEGLAEYYSTFAMVGSREAAIGKVRDSHVFELRERFIPLAELLSVGHDSALYNEGDRRSIFYAESWALVHYLLLGNPARRPQLSTYLEKHASGISAAQAFREAFGTTDVQMEKELRGYVQRSVYQSQRYTFTERVSVDRDWTIEKVSEADGQAALTDLLYHMRRVDEAATRAEAALAQAPGHPRLSAILGRARHHQQRHEEARTLLAQAADTAGDDVQPLYYRAVSLLQPEGDGAPAPNQGTAKVAVALLTRVVATQPTLAHAQMLLGYAHLLLGDGIAALPPLTAAFKNHAASRVRVHGRAGARRGERGRSRPADSHGARGPRVHPARPRGRPGAAGARRRTRAVRDRCAGRATGHQCRRRGWPRVSHRGRLRGASLHADAPGAPAGRNARARHAPIDRLRGEGDRLPREGRGPRARGRRAGLRRRDAHLVPQRASGTRLVRTASGDRAHLRHLSRDGGRRGWRRRHRRGNRAPAGGLPALRREGNMGRRTRDEGQGTKDAGRATWGGRATGIPTCVAHTREGR